jgi:hypothetical protein
MKITHKIDHDTQTVTYRCRETGRSVLVRMVDLKSFKNTQQLVKHLTDKGLFDKAPIVETTPAVQ